MARYKLLQGKHVGPHPDYTLGDDGKWRDKKDREHTTAPNYVYGSGESGGIFIESDKDLVAEFGKEKFELVEGEEPVTELPEGAPPDLNTSRTSAFPGGQVLEGHQVTTTDANGNPITGVLTPAAYAPATFDSKRRAANLTRREAKTEVKAETKAELEDKTVAELHDIARDEDISLHGATLKDDIVAAIVKERRKKSG
jgi:hypothetical protein